MIAQPRDAIADLLGDRAGKPHRHGSSLPAEDPMTDFELYRPTVDEVRSGDLGRRLRRFNYGFVGEYAETAPVWLNAKNGDGEVVGGLRGFVFLHWLTIDILFVDESTRGRGLGRRLLAAAEEQGRTLGAAHVKLETFEWQARAFYLKQGYAEFARIDDFVPGFYLAYMRKVL